MFFINSIFHHAINIIFLLPCLLLFIYKLYTLMTHPERASSIELLLEKWFCGHRPYTDKTPISVLLACFVTLAGQTSTMCTFAPRIYEFAAYFCVDLNYMQMFPMVYMIAAPLFGGSALVLVDKLDLVIYTQAAAWFLTVGNLIRLIGFFSRSFLTCFVGQIITTLCTGVNMTPAKVGNIWFTPKNRPLATAITVASNPLGILVVYLITHFKMNLQNYFVFASVIGVLCGPATFWLLHGYPRFKSEDNKQNMTKVKDIFALLKIKQVWYLILAQMALLGLGMVLIVFAFPLWCPFGYDKTFVNSYGVCTFLALGIFGSTLAGKIVGLYGHPDKVAKILLLVSVVNFYFMTTVLDPNDVMMGRNRFVMLMINFAMMGVLASSVMPLLYELAIETCYPLKAGLATGMLWLTSNIAGTVWTFLYMRFSTDFYPSMQVDVLNNMTQLPIECYPDYNGTDSNDYDKKTANSSLPIGLNHDFLFINTKNSGYTTEGKARFGMPIQVKLTGNDTGEDVSAACLEKFTNKKRNWAFADSCGILETGGIANQQCSANHGKTISAPIQNMKYYGDSYFYSFYAYVVVSLIFTFFYKCSFKRTNTEKELSDRARTTEMATCDEVAKNEKSTKNIVERNEKGSVDEKTPSLPSPTPASPDQSSPVPQQ